MEELDTYDIPITNLEVVFGQIFNMLKFKLILNLFPEDIEKKMQ